MKIFTLYWPDGTKQLVVGNDILHAFDRHRLSAARIPELSLTSETGDTHYWDQATQTWTPYSESVTIPLQPDQHATRTYCLDQLYRTRQLTYTQDDTTITLTRSYSKYAIIGPVIALTLEYRSPDRFSSDTLAFDQDYYGVLGYTDLLYNQPINEAVVTAFTPVSDLKQALLNPT